MKLEYIHIKVPSFYNVQEDFVQPTGKSIELQEDTYVVQEYTYKDGIRSIGIQIQQPTATKAYIATKQNGRLHYLRPLFHSEKTGYWYDRGLYEEVNGNLESVDQPLGMNQCGTYYLIALNAQDTVLEISKPIQVLPSLITHEEFQSMIDDLATIGDWLLHHAELEQSLEIEDWEKQQATKATAQVDDLVQLLQEMDRKPAEQLEQDRERVPYRQVKRMDSRMLIEREMLPFQESIYAPVTRASFNVYEHRAIRGTLEFLHEKWTSRWNAAQVKLRSLQNSLMSLPQIPIYNAADRNNTNEEQRFIAEQTPLSIQAKQEAIKKAIAAYEDSCTSWEKAVRQVEDLLELRYLQNLPHTEDLQPSYLFSMDSHYATAYDMLVSLLQYDHEPWVLHFHDSLKKTPDLYETWCFLKICSLLVKEGGFHPTESIMSQIRNHAASYDGQRPSLLSGLSLTFRRPVHKFKRHQERYRTATGTMELTIHYDAEVNDRDGRLLRPDIRLDFAILNTNSRASIYLDMKYKPIEHIERDIREVAVHKYYERMNQESFASFIIQPSTAATTWSWTGQGTNNRAHTFGAFCMRPADTKEWTIFLTMLLHYRMHFWNTCCVCGSHTAAQWQTEQTMGNHAKFYITCSNPSCRSFYVRSHCGSPGCHKPLCKYPPHSGLNYHRVQGKQWFVDCPHCEND